VWSTTLNSSKYFCHLVHIISRYVPLCPSPASLCTDSRPIHARTCSRGYTLTTEQIFAVIKLVEMNVWIRVPRNSFQWLLKIVAITIQAKSVLPMISVKFGTVTSPSGAPWCSLDLPSMLMQMMSGNMIATCAMECLKNECCMFYQFKENSFRCELFEYTTTNFTVIPSCSSQRTTISK
jgi:hypothetical protein